jgi:hypothetical protein
MTTAESVVRPHSSLPNQKVPDRREHRRAPLSIPVLVDTLSNWQRARCHDVSAGGVSLECENSLPVGKTVELYFELPSGVAVEARARVVRSNKGTCALRFLTLDSETEVALRAHCRAATVR